MRDYQEHLLSYAGFVEAATASVVDAGPTTGAVALLVVDIDHFQRLASIHGEAYAREAFQSVLALIRRGLRRGDIVSHPGGDELIILLRASAREAKNVADRLCGAIRGHAFPPGASGAAPRITISIGVAAAPQHGTTYAALHAAADAARVRLKGQGRDGAVMASLANEAQPRPLAVDRFAGRVEELQSLVAWLDTAVAGEPQIVAVSGEGGSGTATLVRRLEPEVRLRGGSLVSARCRDLAVRAAYDVWTALLTALCRLPNAPDRQWRELHRLVPQLGAATPAAEAKAGSKYRLFEELTEYLRESARQQPLVIVIDEMQWADDASWEALEHVVQRLGVEQLMICITMRSDPAFAEAAQRGGTLAHYDGYHNLQLSRFTRDEVKRWLEAALHNQEVGREFLAFLYRHTEGNPLFISELLRTLVEEGALWHNGERWEWSPVSELRLPAGLSALVSRRLSRFSSSTQVVLSTAAIIGREFDTALVVAAGAGSEPAVRLALSEALAAGILKHAYEREGRGYSFSYDHAVNVLLGSVSPDRVREMHERVAKALDRRPGYHAAEIALHYDSAGAAAPAYVYAIAAASQAEGVYALTAAVQFLHVAARNATSPGELAEVRVRLATLAEASGRYDEAQELCDLAIEWFEGQGDKARALTLRRMRERARKETGQPARVTHEALLALEGEANELGLEGERIAIRVMLAQTHSRLGDRAAAERVAAEAVDMAESLGDQTLLAEALNRLGFTVEQDTPKRAKEIYTRALAICEQTGDVRSQTRCRINIGNVAAHEGRWEEARKAYLGAMGLAKLAGAPDSWGIAAVNLGVIAHRTGDHNRARELFGEAIALFATVKNSELQLYGLYNMAHVDWESGAWESGAELYEATASLAQRIGADDVEVGATAARGLCLFELGRLDATREAYAEVERRIGGRTNWFQGREFVEALAVRLLLADGYLDQAFGRLEEATPMAEATDRYCAAWLVATCARGLLARAPSRVRPLLDRYASQVVELGYSDLGKQYVSLLSL